MSFQAIEDKIPQLKEEIQKRTSLITQLLQQIDKEKASIHLLTGYLQACEDVKVLVANNTPLPSDDINV